MTTEKLRKAEVLESKIIEDTKTLENINEARSKTIYTVDKNIKTTIDRCRQTEVRVMLLDNEIYVNIDRLLVFLKEEAGQVEENLRKLKEDFKNL